MELVTDFAAWAWARHHNEWSWYIRPLLLPFCYFAYQRRWSGIWITLLALATSMFWFPAPATVSPRVVDFLAMEKEWLTGGWTLVKVILTPSVPIFFWLLGWAFWQRSWGMGVLLVNAAMLGKVAWSFFYGGDSAWSLLPPAVVGVLICNVFFWLAYRWITRRQSLSLQTTAA